jgi:hypothetical protein
MTRQEANIRILGILAKAIIDRPDERFGQLLRNLGAVRERTRDNLGRQTVYPEWVNEFNTESEFTLNNMIAEEKK